VNILEECGFTLLIDNIWVKYDYLNGDKVPKYYANMTLGYPTHVKKQMEMKYIIKKADILNGVALITHNKQELKDFITRESRDTRIDDLLS
jgi:predicted RNA-binding protein